ncbi:MAG: ABC transporter ATP-binding protein [Gaiellaceae bacterium]
MSANSGKGVQVVVEHVRKSFEGGLIRSLEDVTMGIEPGEFVSLMGPSGSGKSTLLNLIGALDKPDSGSIRVGSHRIESLSNPSEYRAGVVGFVFQLSNLIPTLSALENVQVPMFGRHHSRKERETLARELLEEVGLSHRLDANPGTLSGGERQRVAIARALANRPCLLLADEPTGALDSVTGERIMLLLKRLREQHQMTTLVVTNDVVVAAAADRAYRMRDGRVEPLDQPPTPAAEPQPERA